MLYHLLNIFLFATLSTALALPHPLGSRVIPPALGSGPSHNSFRYTAYTAYCTQMEEYKILYINN